MILSFKDKPKSALNYSEIKQSISSKPCVLWYTHVTAKLFKFVIVEGSTEKGYEYFQQWGKYIILDSYYVIENRQFSFQYLCPFDDFFSKYDDNGCFFTDVNNAVHYMVERIHSKYKYLTPNVEEFILNHPELLI